jgi:hypothetical protein
MMPTGDFWYTGTMDVGNLSNRHLSCMITIESITTAAPAYHRQEETRQKGSY